MTPAPALPPIARAGTRDRLSGHANHLTEDQKVKLDGFEDVLQSKGYYRPADADTPASHDDTTLLRFLRARKFEIDGAVRQFTASEDWRKTKHVAETYDEFPVDEMHEASLVYPQWTGRRDKAGLPLYLFKVGALTSDAIKRYNKQGDRLDVRMIALYEHMVQFILPFCSAIPHDHPETPVSATTTIVDISGVSLSRFWNLRSHMQRASTLATANYAETLGAIYIVGAPNFFSTVWGWIGRWFDPGTIEKIFILSSEEVFPVLSRFINIEDIPVQYGGKLKFDFTANVGPNLDEAAKKTLGLDKLPPGSVRWNRGELVLKGTGRSEEEVKAIEAMRRSQTPNGIKKEQEATPPSDNEPFDAAKAPAHPPPSASAVSTTPAPSPSTAPPQKPELTSSSSDDSPPSATPSSHTPSFIAAIEAEKADGPQPISASYPTGRLALGKPIPAASSDGLAPAITDINMAPPHDIATAARENAAAPIKDLAAALEGTTL